MTRHKTFQKRILSLPSAAPWDNPRPSREGTPKPWDEPQEGRVSVILNSRTNVQSFRQNPIQNNFSVLTFFISILLVLRSGGAGRKRRPLPARKPGGQSRSGHPACVRFPGSLKKNKFKHEHFYGKVAAKT